MGAPDHITAATPAGPPRPEAGPLPRLTGPRAPRPFSSRAGRAPPPPPRELAAAAVRHCRRRSSSRPPRPPPPWPAPPAASPPRAAASRAAAGAHRRRPQASARPLPLLRRRTSARDPADLVLHADLRSKIQTSRSKSRNCRSMCSCSWLRNFASVAPIHAYSISKCSSQRVHHYIPLHHFHLSSS